ncbi:MAG: FAD binding domain-containing protein [Jatrophihabitans sp.]
MIPAPFEYVRAGSVEEALALLQEHGDEAKLLAGGHSLLPMIKLHLAMPAVLIDLGRIADLDYVRLDGDTVAIGAMATHAAVAGSDVVAEHAPLLAHAAQQVGDPQVRHRGTFGGSLAHADPAADMPLAALTVGATMVAQGPSGRREIAAEDFFTGFFSTALGEDELLVEIRVPSLAGHGWGYEKFTRRGNDWAIVGAATVARRVALANMGPAALRATVTEQALAGGGSIEDAAAHAADGTEPVNDLHADQEYRRHLARVLTARALHTAAGATR